MSSVQVPFPAPVVERHHADRFVTAGAIVEQVGVKPDRYREPLFCEDEPDDEEFSWSRW